MSDIQDLVESVIIQHRFERHSISTPGEFKWWGHCTGCGFEGPTRRSNAEWELNMRDDEARHVAWIIARAVEAARDATLTGYQGSFHG